MPILDDHHNRICSFLEKVRDNTSGLSLIGSKTNEWELLNLIIDRKNSRILQQDAADKLKIKTYNLGRSLRLKLNELLEEFCEGNKCEITPPIRLYFNTDGKRGPGGHFACCHNGDNSSNQSTLGEFIAINDLENMLEKALTKLLSESGNENAESCLQQFRGKLQNQAEKALKDKLDGHGYEDYWPLRLEIGEASETRPEGTKYKRPLPKDHNRIWSSFDIKNLKNLDGKYILSSGTGSGKTTFLRNLQLMMLDEKDTIPLFFDKEMLQELKFHNCNKDVFINSVAALFKGYVDGDKENDFLKNHFHEIIFLIDGLDQISGSGTDYSNYLNKIFQMTNKAIVSSRPFAAIQYEDKDNTYFLRLCGFTEEDQKKYLGKNFELAKNLCTESPELLSIPMLAYMIRLLIEEEWHGYIQNRANLYEAFVNYIMERHHSKNQVSFSEQEKIEIIEALKKISFEAINEKEPLFQMIPFDFAARYVNKIGIDQLFKSGIVNFVVNRTYKTDKFIYFTHQSFQEYFAAEYAAQNTTVYEKILKEKWSEKWSDVIRFLANIKKLHAIELITGEKSHQGQEEYSADSYDIMLEWIWSCGHDEKTNN